MKIKNQLKSCLAICLVLMMAVSTIAVSATEGQATESNLQTIYTKDFTLETADTDGWSNQEALAITNSKMSIAGNTTTFYETDLTDSFKISGKVSYGWNGAGFILNGDGTNKNVGVEIHQGKATFGEEFNEEDPVHQAYKEANPDKTEYSYRVEFIDVFVNGTKPADWKTLVYVDEADKERTGYKEHFSETASIYNTKTVDYEYCEETIEIEYNKGVISFKAALASEVREFTYDLTKEGAAVPVKNKGYFGIVTDGGGAWVTSIQIQKAKTKLVTVYEQNFTEESLTVADLKNGGLLTKNATIDEADGLKLDVNQALVYKKALGDKWRVSGQIKGAGRNETYWLNYNFYLNSDAQIAEDVFSAENGYVIKHNKNGYEFDLLKDGNTSGNFGHYRIADCTYENTNPIEGIMYLGYINFEIEMNGTNLTCTISSVDGSTVYAQKNIDLTKNINQDVPEKIWTDGRFALINNTENTTVSLKNLKIETEASDYITAYENDFTANGATADGFSLLGATIDTENGLKIEENQAFVYDKPLGNKWRVSGKINATGWNTDERDQYTLGYNVYLNSDVQISGDELTAQNGYMLKATKMGYDFDFLKDGQNGGDLSQNAIAAVGYENVEPNIGIFYLGELNFEMEMNGASFTYKLTTLDGSVVYNSVATDLSKNINGDALPDVWADGKFGMLNKNFQTKICLKTLKIEVIEDYAVAEVEASVDESNSVSYSAIIHNNTENPLNDAILMAAVYDANGVMIGLEQIDYSGAVGMEGVSGVISLAETSLPAEVVVYFWEDFATIAPIYTDCSVKL